MNIQWNKTQLLLTIGLLAVGLLLGYLLFGGGHDHAADDHSGHAHEMTTDANGEEVWTCSMHPSIREDGPGTCPICGMDLIPAAAAGEDEGEYHMVMSEAAMGLAEVQTTEIRMMQPEREVRLPGRVVADERSISSVSAHFPGRITQLDVNFTGAQIRQGEVLARIYSPELVAAQRELLEAVRYEAAAPEMLQSARQKLRQWELSEAEINRIIERGEVHREMDITSPADGVVMSRNVSRQDYVEQGTVLFEVADLSSLWLRFEAYEDDISWLAEGDSITFSTRANPGQTYTASVDFIDPMVNPQNRTVGVRANFDNSQAQLRPDMILSGSITAGTNSEQQLMIPASAVLWTGPRSITYVRDMDAPTPRFESREIQIGPRMGDYYAVHEGVREGEHVVFNGAFKIDSEFQLADRFSMMNRRPGTGAVPAGHDHGDGAVPEHDHSKEVIDLSEQVSDEFRAEFTDMLHHYLELKDALVESGFEEAAAHAAQLRQELESIGEHRHEGEAHMAWMETYTNLMAHLEPMVEAENIDGIRGEFRFLSQMLVEAVQTFGVEGVVYHQYCPMAFDDEGGYWISGEEQIQNPYLPETMLMCGEVIERVE